MSLLPDEAPLSPPRPLVCVVTSIHPDYDARVFRHARALAELGYEVDLVCPWRPSPYPLPEGLRIVPFRRVTDRLLRPFLVPARLLPLLLRRPYRLFHFHDLDVLPFFALLKLLLRRPVVYDCHENYAEEMLYRSYRLPGWIRPALALGVRWVERACAAVLRDVVIVVPSQRATFPAPWFRTVLVRNYAERALERGSADDLAARPPACISIASQYVDNGALLLPEIARALRERGRALRFYAADRFGDLALRTRVLARVAELGLGEAYAFLPNVPPPEIMTNLNRATIGLALDHPSPARLRALPIKLFEYMAAGLPIVAADLPNIREVITAARCGVLVSPGDPEAFADAIAHLLDHPEEARAMGARGRAAFRATLNWEAEAARLRPVYDRLLGRAGEPSPAV